MMESVSSMDNSNDFSSNRFDDIEGEVEDGELIEDDILESESDKLSLRAKRFGLLESKTSSVNPELEKFHKSMGVDKDTRTEALHLLGTDNMKTLDVFDYFSGYSPASLEWISDKSCNVVWLNEEACANALKKCSFKIKGINVESDDLDENEETIDIEDIRCAVPPGIWRKGHSNSLAPHLFIRYATQFDKKKSKPPSHIYGNEHFNKNVFLDQGDEVAKKLRLETGNPWSDIARQWRNFENKAQPAGGPVKDAREVINHDVRKSKSLLRRLYGPTVKTDESDAKPNLLSSRKMQADIEEKKILERNKKQRSNYAIRERAEVDLREHLGRKRKRTDYDSDEPDDRRKRDTDSSEREDISLRIEIDNSKDSHEESWHDGKSDGSDSNTEYEKQSSTQQDLRSKLIKKKSSHHHHHHHHHHHKKDISLKSVLRTNYTKHSSSRRSPTFSSLRIEIDNDVYRGSGGEED